MSQFNARDVIRPTGTNQSNRSGKRSKESPRQCAINVADVDVELWKRFKDLAARKCRTLGPFLSETLEEYLDRHCADSLR